MIRKTVLFAAVPALMLAACSGGDNMSTQAQSSAASAPTTPARSADQVLADVVAAMGAGNIDSITFTGAAWQARNGFMQTPNASPPWPYRDYILDYTRTIDLTAPASVARGDTLASNIFYDPPVAGTYNQNVTADQTDWAQQLEIWLTPWGFIKGAEDNGVTSSTAEMGGMQYTVLSWMSPADQTSPSGMRYTVNAYIDANNLIDHTETWVEHPFMGDFHIVNVYDDYQRIDGVMIPTIMEQQRGGGSLFGVHEVMSAAINPPNLAELMTVPARQGGGFGGGGGGAPTDVVEQLGEGVWLIKGGYVALAAEFSDHVLVVEAGQSEANGQLIVDTVHELVPDKPIRYIVNSHPHSDHTAGLVPLIRDGATLVTHELNVDFLTMALSTPRTLLGEEPLNPTVQGVEGVGVFDDGTMRVELHPVPNFHTEGMLVALVPSVGVLFEADFTLPMGDAAPNPFVTVLANYVRDNDLQFERYLAVHPAPVPQTRADLMATLD